MSARPIERWLPLPRGAPGRACRARAEAVGRFRAGEFDAFAVDEVIHQYQRAARELWKFGWLGGSGGGGEFTARALRDMADQHERTDWWQLGAPRERWAARP